MLIAALEVTFGNRNFLRKKMTSALPSMVFLVALLPNVTNHG